MHVLFHGKKLSPEIQTKVDRCQIPTERLTVGEQIGKGNFGMVYKGQLVTPSGNLKSVAVKTLKGNLHPFWCTRYCGGWLTSSILT